MKTGNEHEWLLWGLALFGGGYVLYNYFFVEPETPDPLPIVSEQPATPARPSGRLPVATLDSGTVWRIDTSEVQGSREERLVWVREDHSEDASTQWRETHVLYQIDCTTSGYKVLSALSYDPDGKPSQKVDFEPQDVAVKYAVPASVVGGVVRVGCMPEFDIPLN